MHLPMTLLGLAALSIALSPMALASPARSTSRPGSPSPPGSPVVRSSSTPSTGYRSRSNSLTRSSAPNPCLKVTKDSDLDEVNPCIAEMIKVELRTRKSSPPNVGTHQRILERAIKHALDDDGYRVEHDVNFKKTLLEKAGKAIGQYVDWLQKTTWEEDDRNRHNKKGEMTEKQKNKKMRLMNAIRKRDADEKRMNERMNKTPEKLTKELKDLIVVLSIFTNIILRLPAYYETEGKDKLHRYEYMVMSIGVLSLQLSSRTRTDPDWEEQVRDILQGAQEALDQKIKMDKMEQVNLEAYVRVNENLINEARKALTNKNMHLEPGSTYNGEYIPIDVPTMVEERKRRFKESERRMTQFESKQREEKAAFDKNLAKKVTQDRIEETVYLEMHKRNNYKSVEWRKKMRADERKAFADEQKKRLAQAVHAEELETSWIGDRYSLFNVYKQQFERVGKVNAAEDAEKAVNKWEEDLQRSRPGFMNDIENVRKEDGSGSVRAIQKNLYKSMWLDPGHSSYLEDAFFFEEVTELAR